MSLVEKWTSGSPTFGAWMWSADPTVAETAARNDFDYVCIDQQHGTGDYRSLLDQCRAIEIGGAIPITRVPWNEPGIIGRSLDGGIHGVIVPMVNTPAEAEAVVRACRYAPNGARSYGPIIPGLRNKDVMGFAAANVTAIPMIETTQALDNLDDILSVPGIDAIYVGPADLSLTLGLPPKNNDGEAAFDDALTKIVDACQRHSVFAGIHSTGALAAKRVQQGFSMVTVVSDTGAMEIGMRAELERARSGGADAADSPSMY